MLLSSERNPGRLAAMTASERRNFWIGLIVVLLLAGVAVSLAVLAWRYAVAIFPQAGSTTITAIATFIGSALTLVITKRWERRREIQQELRRQKTPLYEEFISFLFRLLMSSKAGQSLTEEEMTSFMVKFTQGLTIWGSNEVIQKYGQFRQMSTDNPDAAKLTAAVEDILFSIRSDLGHPGGLRRGDLLRLFINDLDKLIPGA
jgi:hypothetical protein